MNRYIINFRGNTAVLTVVGSPDRVDRIPYMLVIVEDTGNRHIINMNAVAFITTIPIK